MPSPQPMHIVACGARTPVGLNAPSSAAAVRASISRLGIHPYMVDGRGEPVRMALDARLDRKLFGWRRMVPLVTTALAEVIRQIPMDEPAGDVLIALPEARPGFTDSDARELVATLENSEQLRGFKIWLRGRGHAGVLHAMQYASQALASGRRELCIVAGVDSYLEADTIDWLDDGKQLLGKTTRNGMVPGEGAGAIVLTANPRLLELQPLATVRHLGTALESKLIKTDAEILGEGLYAAVREATSELELPAQAIDAVFCDINGERYRTDEWGFALLRLGSVLRATGYEAPTDCWGDVGAATGVLACVLAVHSWMGGYAKGPRALIWAGSESGLRCAAVLEQPVV